MHHDSPRRGLIPASTKWLLTLLLAFPFGCASQIPPPPEPFPGATPRAIVNVTEQIFPAVVRLDVAQRTYSHGKRSIERGIGSGVIIDAQGRILTNYHVAGRAIEIYVTLADKERVPAKLIGDDHWTDLAIVQMDMKEVTKKNIRFNYARLGDSDTLAPGQAVMAIGTPFGLARTLTLGVVSNTQRTFYPVRMTIDGSEYETGEFNNWIQMDTPINPGNSGGPLVDMNGDVVGINTLGSRVGQGLGFAIPINTAKEVIRKILADAAPDKPGKVSRSDLGINLKPLQDLETFYKLDVDKGVLINSVDRGSAADKAGVRTQDILLKINKTPINVRFPEQVAPARKRIADLPIGSNVALLIKRGDQLLTLHAKTQKLESAVGEQEELKTWGLSVRDVTRAYANDHQLDDAQGAVVTTLSPGKPADNADLQAGDVIRSINQQEVTDLDELMKLYGQSTRDRQEMVLLEIQRGGHGRRTMVLKVHYPKTATAPATTQSADQE